MLELLNIQALSQAHLSWGSHSSAWGAVHSAQWVGTLPLFIPLKPLKRFISVLLGKGKEELRQWKVRCRHHFVSCAGTAVCSPGPLTLILSAVPKVMSLPHFAEAYNI